MQITINTKEDSKEELMHIINLLHNIVGIQKTERNADIFANSAPNAGENSASVFNIFDSPKTDSTDTDNSMPVLKTVESKETPEETPEIQIIEY